jgi:hypothetical protein
MLVWNEYDFIECLGVLPEVKEYKTSHFYKVEKDGLRLELTVFQYDGDIYIDLFRDKIEHSVFRMRMIDCPGVRYVKNQSGTEYLELAATNSFGSRYDGESVIPFGVRLTVNPNIRIELF